MSNDESSPCCRDGDAQAWQSETHRIRDNIVADDYVLDATGGMYRKVCKGATDELSKTVWMLFRPLTQ